jgi:hypothetical protein
MRTVETAVFDDWFETIFVGAVAKSRKKFSYQGPCFMIVDICSAHSNDRFQAPAEAIRVRQSAFPARI